MHEKLIFFPRPIKVSWLFSYIIHSLWPPSFMHLYQSAQVTIHCWPKHGSYPLIVNIYISMYRSDSVGSIFCSWIRLRVRGTISPGVEPILLVSLSLVRIRIGGKVGSWSDNNIKGCIIGDIPAWTICLFAQNWTNYIIITLYLV